MQNLRKANDQQLEAQRDAASQAAREQSELDPRAVLIAAQVKVSEGRIAEARQIVADWKASQVTA